MENSIKVLKPGYLVSLKTSVKGGIHYFRRDVEADHLRADGQKIAKWETTRAIENPEEFEKAIRWRNKARSLVISACVPSAFGLLCPTDRRAELDKAIEDAHSVVNSFNREAVDSRIEVFVLMGRVAQDDEEAARAIASEVRDLLDEMRAGIDAANPEKIREAANKARTMNAMLSDDAAGKVTAAISEARLAARAITKRVGKAGEEAAKVVAEVSVKAIKSARFAVLDLPSDTVEVAPVESVPQAGRDLDFTQPNDAEKLMQRMKETGGALVILPPSEEE